MPRPNSAKVDLSYWWQHTASVRRWNGDSAYGNDFDDAADVTGLYEDQERLVVGPDGVQILAAGIFYYPADEPLIPVQSEINLPAPFDSRTMRVISEITGSFGALPFANYKEVGLV